MCSTQQQSGLAKPDGRPRLDGVHYKYPTSCSLPTYPSSTYTSCIHWHTPTNYPPLPGL